MTGTVKKYPRRQKNQEKIDEISKELAKKVHGWLDESPTGSFVLSFEINATDGNVRDCFMEHKARGRV